MTPSEVSIQRDKAITSFKRKSPEAAVSLGLIDLFNSFSLKSSDISLWITGVRVELPTKEIS